MATKNIFLSFDDEDLELVNLFRGQAKIKNSELEFKDYSVKEPYDSKNADYIKSQIRPQIKSCSNLIVLFGKNTYKSKWVDWEMTCASTNDKNIFGVILDSENFQYVSHHFKSEGFPLVKWNHDAIMKQLK